MYVEEALFTSPRAKSQGGGGGGKAWDISKLHFVRMCVCMYCVLNSACEATGRAQYSHVVDCNLKNKNKKTLFFFFFSIFFQFFTQTHYHQAFVVYLQVPTQILAHHFPSKIKNQKKHIYSPCK